MAYRNSGKFNTLQIAEDQDEPDSSYTKVDLLDAAPDAGGLDVYLMDPSAALVEESPTFSGVAAGSVSAYNTMASGAYRIG